MTADSLYIVQGLWIGGALSTAEKLCIRSFQHHGHEFHLYVYDDVDGIPSGTIIKDANTVVPAERIFRYKDNGSVAGFANLFRYALLFANGGAWADMDMVCLKPIPKQYAPIIPLQSYR
ncbi:MAG: mannosyltransferase OCH1-like enzyme, partial [Glaciecola sp.]